MIAATAQFSSQSISIRCAQAADIEVCGRICYEAFTTKDTNKRKEEKYYLYLDGFTYGRIASQGHINVDRSLGWLGRQPQSPFRPQPYLQLARLFRSPATQMALCR